MAREDKTITVDHFKEGYDCGATGSRHIWEDLPTAAIESRVSIQICKACCILRVPMLPREDSK